MHIRTTKDGSIKWYELLTIVYWTTFKKFQIYNISTVKIKTDYLFDINQHATELPTISPESQYFLPYFGVEKSVEQRIDEGIDVAQPLQDKVKVVEFFRLEIAAIGPFILIARDRGQVDRPERRPTRREAKNDRENYFQQPFLLPD